MKNNISENYNFIETDDGSLTVFSKLYGEACHSTSGAIKETHTHYINGCEILEKSKSKHINILEVGFGVGIGFLETAKTLKDVFFSFVTMEIDEDLVKYVISKNSIFNGILKKDYFYELKNDNFHLVILIGNARESLVKYKNDFNPKFECIYQDAFSPKRNAILWTKEWFDLLYSMATSTCIMSTYSSSSSIRKSMLKANWKLYKGEKFGPKRSSTRAKVTGETDADILTHLENSPVHAITDENHFKYTMDNKNEKN
jgi:tRNA U34 5-methylaminomethyl-2-thiouridine-forming methyltransferase MnmC